MNQGKVLKVINILALMFLVSSCVFVPRESKYQAYHSGCDLVTRKLTLDMEDYLGLKEKLKDGKLQARSENDVILIFLAGSGVVTAASAVVSGSIVLVGNVIHWSEYAVRC